MSKRYNKKLVIAQGLTNISKVVIFVMTFMIVSITKNTVFANLHCEAMFSKSNKVEFIKSVNNSISQRLLNLVISSIEQLRKSGLKESSSEKKKYSNELKSARIEARGQLPYPPAGPRGYIPRLPEGYSAEQFSKDYDDGIHVKQRWRQAIFHVKSLQEAIEHQAKIENPLDRGLYIVSDLSVNLNELSKFQSEDKNNNLTGLNSRVGKTFQQILDNNSGVYDFIDGKPVKLSDDYATYLFAGKAQENDVEILIYEKEPETNGFYVKGPCVPSVIGILSSDNILKKKNSRNLIRKLYDWLQYGTLRVVFDYDFKTIYEMAETQVRPGQTLLNNRQTDPAVKAYAFKRNKEGTASTVAILDSNNTIVASVITYFNKDNGDLETNTVMRNASTVEQLKNIPSIEFAKMILLVVISHYGIQNGDNLVAQAGMVTPFTDGQGAVYIQKNTYVDLLKLDRANRGEIPRDFDTLNMASFTHEDLKKAFKDAFVEAPKTSKDIKNHKPKVFNATKPQHSIRSDNDNEVIDSESDRGSNSAKIYKGLFR